MGSRCFIPRKVSTYILEHRGHTKREGEKVRKLEVTCWELSTTYTIVSKLVSAEGIRVTGQGRTGGTGEGRAGQGRTGQGRAGQGRAGQGRTGQGRTGQKEERKEGRGM